MTDRPILFKTDMVMAILQGRKTQTRRLNNPGYAVGDRLWVREEWRPDPNGCEKDGMHYVRYRADGGITLLRPAEGWKFPKAAYDRNVPGIHMPRWASRLTLIVTDVRRQPVQEITLRDARAEGVNIRNIDLFGADTIEKRNAIGRAYFANLWRRINGADAWGGNPIVTALTFEVLKRNIDQPLRDDE